MNCPSCGKDNPPNTKFCLACGGGMPRRVPRPPPPPRRQMPTPAAEMIPLPPQMAGPAGGATASGYERETFPCSACGNNIEPQHRFCPTCGEPVGDDNGKMPQQSAAEGARLTSLYPDGTEATAFQLSGKATTVGRDSGGIFAADQYLSPRHATFIMQGGVVMVRDESSLNGIFRRIPHEQRYPLSAGQLFRIGQELVRFETLEPIPLDDDGVEVMGAPMDGYVGRIAMMVGRDTSSTAFPIPESGLSIGRERGEVLFADDGYVSGLHCRLSYENGSVYITDLGSSNGTFVRIHGSDAFHHGDVMLLGQQLFRVDL